MGMWTGVFIHPKRSGLGGIVIGSHCVLSLRDAISVKTCILILSNVCIWIGSSFETPAAVSQSSFIIRWKELLGEHPGKA